MRNQLLRFVVLALCAGLLPGAQRPAVEYRIWAGSPPNVLNGPRDTTYVFDARWRQRSISPDEWVLARHSSTHIRLHTMRGRWWYSLGGKPVPSECGNDGDPFTWIIAPLGSVYACVNDYYPNTTLHLFRSRDHRAIATIKLPEAYVGGRNSIAFLDEDRVLFAKIDDSCPRERRSKLRRSIFEISIGARPSRGIVFKCASGVIVGARRVAYLREFGTEYSLDGGAWVSQSMYGFDKDDNPITEGSPPIRTFKTRHPDLAIWLISIGQAPVGEGG
jgi:hypothetical protein